MKRNYLGSSTLDVPFAFPDGEVKTGMAQLGVTSTQAEIEQILVIYWDAIDAGKIKPLSPYSPASERSKLLNYLMSQGVDRTIGGAWITGMVFLSDPSWLRPSWGLTHSAIHGGKDSLFGLPSLGVMMLWSAGLFIVYGMATTATSSFFGARRTA